MEDRRASKQLLAGTAAFCGLVSWLHRVCVVVS